MLQLPAANTVLDTVGQRVCFALLDGHVADLRRGAFTGLYERTDQLKEPAP